MIYQTETILALLTPAGEGAISVFRLSGPQSVLAASLFFKGLAQAAERSLVAGPWRDPSSGEILDEVLCARFAPPRSFTGEEVVELHAHGGLLHGRELQRRLLEASALAGLSVRLAQPGEYSQRAFLNGKMDLTKAEAVALLVRAQSDLSRQAAARQLTGALFEPVEKLRREVLDLCAEAEAALDFPEEEEAFKDRAAYGRSMREALATAELWLAKARQGRALAQGVKVALMGAPNVGKSSLMNALLGRERALVSAEAGTTRDWIEDRFEYEGLSFILIDTAGLRQDAGAIESEGLRRGLDQARHADLVLVLLDASLPWGAPEAAMLELAGPQAWVVLNKCDLPDARIERLASTDLKSLAPHIGYSRVSALTKIGVKELKDDLLQQAIGSHSAALLSSTLLTQARHEEATRRAREALLHSVASFEAGVGPELLAGDLREALDALGEITGATAREDVLQAIFAKFCIGK